MYTFLEEYHEKRDLIMSIIKSKRLYFILRSEFYRIVVRGMKKRDPLFVMNYVGASNNAVSSRYCYTVFMRHIVQLFGNGMRNIPNRVAEFGPGSSIGIGLCAILSGAKEYYALDVAEFAENTRNLEILDELVTLFREKTPIPDDHEFPEVKPKLDNYSFPFHIFNDDIMVKALARERVNSIKNALTGSDYGTDGIIIKYIVPWENYAKTYPCVDLIFSQAVLEHVDNLKRFYDVSRSILAPEGFVSHDIDFRCHNETYEWNGHWAVSDKKWKKIRGSRPFMINREPLSTHLRLLEENGFQIKSKIPSQNSAGGKPSIRKKNLKGKFMNLSNEDFETATCYVIAQMKK